MSENLRGERAPRWKGGISPERDKWYGNGGRKWCRAVKREQCYTCAVCRKVHASRSTQIVVHHKAGYTAYEELRSEPRNGLCVCRSCHFWLHSNAGRAQREAWEREALRELGHLLIAADEAA